jgi:hypothetical protein
MGCGSLALGNDLSQQVMVSRVGAGRSRWGMTCHNKSFWLTQLAS